MSFTAILGFSEGFAPSPEMENFRRCNIMVRRAVVVMASGLLDETHLIRKYYATKMSSAVQCKGSDHYTFKAHI